MYKLIACDLDETLLNDQKKICARNLEAIKRAKQLFNTYFVPATGRGYSGFNEVLVSLDVYQKPDEYIIANNGSILCENKNFKELSFHAIDFEKAKELFAFAYDEDVCIEIYTATSIYVFHVNDEEMQWINRFKTDVKLCESESIAFLKDIKIAKMIFQNTDMKYLRALQEKITPITNGSITTSFSSSRYLELNAFGIDKGKGLKDLAAHLNIDMKDTIAIGDNYNDISMLKVAGLSVAMANAADDIKKVCDIVTQANHNDGGVGEVIEKYILKAK